MHSLSDRDWTPERGARDEEIFRLQAAAPVALPLAYLDLLRFSNGGEGPLAVQPCYFCLYPVTGVLDAWATYGREALENYLVFGSNGAGEYLAFDCFGDQAWAVVMIDPIAGAESAREVAPSFSRFLDLIGIEAEDV